MGRRLTILIAIVLGSALSAAFFISVASHPNRKQLVGNRPLEYWIGCLDSGNFALRESAVMNLPLFGADAAPALIERLDSDSYEIADAAASCLLKIGSPAVPVMTRALHARTGTPARGNTIIDLLGKMGPVTSAPAAGEIALRLEDPNTGHAATEYFLKCGATPEALAAAARALGGKDDYRRRDALRLLGKSQGDPRASDALVAALRSTTDPGTRAAVWRELWTSATRPTTLSPAALIEVTNNLAANETRNEARTALLAAGAPAALPLAQLAQQDDVDEITRIVALDTLSQVLIRNAPAFANSTSSSTGAGASGTGVAVTADIEHGIEQLNRHPSALVRIAAQDCLAVLYSVPGGLTPPPPGGGPVPIAMVAKNLPKMTPSGTPIVMSDPPATNPAVVAVHHNPVLDAALDQLDDPDPSVRTSAENAIRYLAPAPDPGTSADFAATTDAKERIRRVRLLPFGTDPKRYDIIIAALRESGDPPLRRAAVGAMRRSLSSPKVVERLCVALEKDDSAAIRAAAADALAPLRDDPKVHRVLNTAAKFDPAPAVASAAKRALGPG